MVYDLCDVCRAVFIQFGCRLFFDALRQTTPTSRNDRTDGGDPEYRCDAVIVWS